MRPAPRAALVCLILAAGCANKGLPAPCTPGELPSIGKHDLPIADADGAEAETTPATDTPAADPSSDEGTDAAAADETADAPAVTETNETADAPAETSETADASADADADTDTDQTADTVAATDDTDEATDAVAATDDTADAVPATDDTDVATTEPEPADAADPLVVFEAARDDVERSADWLLCVVPDQLPNDQLDAWVERRNLVMDWIENHPTLGYTFSATIMAPIHKDKRFNASMYMNLAYAIGKARYLLSNRPADPIEAEVAALDTVAQYYVTFRTVDPKLDARKLNRLLRKKRKGKLRPWVAKMLAKSGG